MGRINKYSRHMKLESKDFTCRSTVFDKLTKECFFAKKVSINQQLVGMTFTLLTIPFELYLVDKFFIEEVFAERPNSFFQTDVDNELPSEGVYYDELDEESTLILLLTEPSGRLDKRALTKIAERFLLIYGGEFIFDDIERDWFKERDCFDPLFRELAEELLNH